ncbi:hypothetical protein TRFO_27162 [Tritrichomonas foetus]|uniref:Uncharacterized protein n=1 Tax=Tritrichomonas foetus TaxID=1144522 RepID=A0A1J4K1F4_9EUKA|nr:hypothetical protein TRFO_27162 [Tritrichomonas foetus]|eukprot:OHT05215.1 hypothetical protein TRFO_27162 [Tritrichomonas foetus]
MSEILKRSKNKRKDSAKYKYVSFNFNSSNMTIISCIFGVVSLFIGLFYSTDIYRKFNNLPEDRNELMPIKSYSISIDESCLLKVEIDIQAISKSTFKNLFRNLNVLVKSKKETFQISTNNADYTSRMAQHYYFSKQIDIKDNFSVTLRLFDNPISTSQHFLCKT